MSWEKDVGTLCLKWWRRWASRVEQEKKNHTNLELRTLNGNWFFFWAPVMEHQKPPKLHIWSLCHAQKSSVELWVSNSQLSLFILYIIVPWISFSQSMHWHTHYPWTIMYCINHHFFCSEAECVIHPNGETTKSNCISNFLVCQISLAQKQYREFHTNYLLLLQLPIQKYKVSILSFLEVVINKPKVDKIFTSSTKSSHNINRSNFFINHCKKKPCENAVPK